MLQVGARRLVEACQHTLRRSDLSPLQNATACVARSFYPSINALAIDIVVPPMGDSISEGYIATVLKEAASHVDEDEPILKVESDKVHFRLHNWWCYS
jgi:hypothetical protein